MKTKYILLSCLTLISSYSFSQQLLKNNKVDRGTPVLTDAAYDQSNKNTKQQKAPPPGATVFFAEDFGSGSSTSLPTGWTVTNLSSVSTNRWIWSNTAPGGQYSTNIPALNSTSASNGFMSLPAGLFNTPFPAGGPTPMDTWFTSPSFPIGTSVGSVIVEYEHFVRYCCSSTNELVLEVSSDGINWSVPYDAIGGRGPNTLSPNAETLQINVSSDLAFQSNGWIRFRSTGNTHYFWMIDDVAVFEGPDNQIELESFEIKFHPRDTISPVYRFMPVLNMHPIRHTAFTKNVGANDQTNTKSRVEIYMDSMIGGGPGLGLIYEDSLNLGTVLSQQSDISILPNNFNTINPGWYRNRVLVTSDSAFADPSKAEGSYSFALTMDTTFALERGENFFQGSSGPAEYVGGGQDNDAAAALVIIDSLAPPIFNVTSVNVYIPYRGEVHGLQISPRVWTFNQSAAALSSAIVNPPIGASPFSFTIDTAIHGNTWVSLPIFPPIGIGAGSYYYGVEQTGGGTNNKELWIGRDVGQEEIAPTFSNVFFLNDPSNPIWIAPPRVLGIRLNGDFYVGLNDRKKSELDVSLFPNPTNGMLNLEIELQASSQLQINVRDAVGKSVLSDSFNSKGSAKKQIDLSSFDKGIYFISIENGKERIVKKVVVN